MLTALMLLLQAGPPDAAPRPRIARPCPPETPETPSGDVVVCGRRDQEEFRLRPLPDRYEAAEGLPRAATKLGPGTISAETEQVDVGGFPSRRAMVRFKMPL
jgi:hypothetical protein